MPAPEKLQCTGSEVEHENSALCTRGRSFNLCCTIITDDDPRRLLTSIALACCGNISSLFYSIMLDDMMTFEYASAAAGMHADWQSWDLNGQSKPSDFLQVQVNLIMFSSLY